MVVFALVGSRLLWWYLAIDAWLFSSAKALWQQVFGFVELQVWWVGGLVGLDQGGGEVLDV